MLRVGVITGDLPPKCKRIGRSGIVEERAVVLRVVGVASAIDGRLRIRFPVKRRMSVGNQALPAIEPRLTPRGAFTRMRAKSSSVCSRPG